MSPLLCISRAIDSINTAIGRVAAWALLVAVVVSAVNAVVRKVLSVSSNGWLELQWYLFGLAFMLCAAWTLKLNEHIRIDIVSDRLSKRTRDLIDVFGHLFFLFPFCILMIYLSVPFAWVSFVSNEHSSNAGGLPIWPAKAMILAGFIMVTAQGLSELIKRYAILRGVIADTTPQGGHGQTSNGTAPDEPAPGA